VMDSVGNVPVFSVLLKNVAPARRPRVIFRENLIALATLLFFLFFGSRLMALLHIESAALATAGGVVLFVIAFEMIFPDRRAARQDAPVDTHEPLIVPMAIPLIAGPSTMAVLMLMVSQQPGRHLEWTLALLIAWLCGTVVLLLADRLRAWLGPRGLLAIERLMGMILLVLAVQMSIDGLREFLFHR